MLIECISENVKLNLRLIADNVIKTERLTEYILNTLVYKARVFTDRQFEVIWKPPEFKNIGLRR